MLIHKGFCAEILNNSINVLTSKTKKNASRRVAHCYA